MCGVIMGSYFSYASFTKYNAHLTLFTHDVIWSGIFWYLLFVTVFMRGVLHSDRRFWIIQLKYLKEELARTDTEVAEAHSAHTDMDTVC